MNAYVIIGDANTRKSSILRCLTGCFNRSDRDILLSSGRQIRVYARVSSLQESKTTPQDFLKEVRLRGCSDVVFCLWPDANPKAPGRFPDSDSYIKFFRQAGWVFKGAAILGNTRIAPGVKNVCRVPSVRTQPINVSAQLVRTQFGW